MDRNDGQVCGFVALVGAGPGDPDLLTMAAVRHLRRADTIVHDHLIGPRILDHANPAARRVHVGKSCGEHSVPQAEINRILVEHACRGEYVVRLKGGDPFVFGRGAEEALHLVEHRIAFEVVPGVTSGYGALAAAGIPLTHRDCAHAAVLVSAQRCNGEDPDWPSLAVAGRTLVFYMGVRSVGWICANLMSAGLGSGTPAAMVQDGTLPTQRVVVATLADLAERARDAGIGSPALVVVGEVVALSAKLGFAQTASDNHSGSAISAASVDTVIRNATNAPSPPILTARM